MNIVRENIDELSALIRVTVGPEDYGKAVDAALHNYKKKANIPGFRPGMVPIGVVRKMFGKSVKSFKSGMADDEETGDAPETPKAKKP